MYGSTGFTKEQALKLYEALDKDPSLGFLRDYKLGLERMDLENLYNKRVKTLSKTFNRQTKESKRIIIKDLEDLIKKHKMNDSC